MARTNTEDTEPDRDEDVRDEGHEEETSPSSGGFFAELKDIASEAALSVLAPVAEKAAKGAAKYAVKKGPELIEHRLMPMIEDAGGVKEALGGLVGEEGPAGGLLSKLGGGDDGGGDAGDGTGKGRRMPVQQAVDVAAPIEVVYDQWTQFEDYPRFMHRVERVEQSDDSHVVFHSKAWGFNRKWEAEIVEQRPDERIVWKSVDGLQHTGVVTFHDLADRLTRIELNIDIEPAGPVEKIARGARFVKRAARADLKRFKAFVEMHEDETGAWRGEIQDGDVVSDSDDDYEDEYYEDEYEEEDEGEEEEEEEEKEPERKKSPARGRSRSSSGSRSGGSSRSKGSGSKSSGSSRSSSRGQTRSKSSTRSSSRKRGSSNGGDPKKSSRSKGGSRSKRSSSSRSKSSARGRSS